MLIDPEPRYQLAAEWAGQLGWGLVAEERGDWSGGGSTGRSPSCVIGFRLALGQRQTSPQSAFVGSLGHDAEGSNAARRKLNY